MMSLSKYKSTLETANMDRVLRIIRGPFTDLLRDILKKEIPPSDLSRKVKQWTDDVKKYKNKNPLNPSQNDIIYPSPTNQYGGNYSDLDISTLYIILRNVSKLSPPTKGWGETPDPADRSVSANIERIRLLRNKYQHSVALFLSHAEFRQEWRNIWDIVVEVERQLGTGTIYQEYVNEIKTCSMDPKQKQSDMKKKLKLRIDGDNALHYASDIGDVNISSYLVTNYQQLIDLKNNRGDTALHSACVCGDRKLIAFLIEKGLNIDARTNDGDSVLHIACLFGNYDACDFLVTRYPQLLDVKNDNGDTVLHSACVSGDRKLISFLLGKGLDVNALTIDGDSALHIACFHENYDACEFLVTSYLQLIGLKNKKGYTVLHSACENGGRQLISFLLEKGLDVNALTSDGASALHIASCYENYDACEFLVTSYPQLIDIKSNDGSTALHSACVKGDRKLISFLVEKGLDITALTNDGDSALHIACCHENYDACEFLVTNYPQLIDFKNNNGDTVLHAACVNGEGQLISFLLGKGLDITALTNDGDSALHIASCHNNYDACEFFITKHPQLIDVKSNDGSTALHSACVKGDRKLISFLVEKGLDITALTNDGDSVLHIACCHVNYDACEFLVTNYPQLIGLKNKKGYTVLHSACENGETQLISFLLEKGLDISALTTDGDSALHIGSCYDNYDACEFLVTNYPQLIGLKNKKGYTALHSACENGKEQLISFLIENGLDINDK